jgi:hypothetical protein
MSSIIQTIAQKNMKEKKFLEINEDTNNMLFEIENGRQ